MERAKSVIRAGIHPEGLKLKQKIEGITVFACLLLVGGFSCTKKEVPVSATEIRMQITESVFSLDPHQVSSFRVQEQLGLVYDSLLAFNADEKKGLGPNLVDSMPEVSADRKVYTFRLKPGIVFHDDPAFSATQGRGRELTADDVVFSFNRLLSEKTKSPFAFSLRLVVDDESGVSWVKAVDRFTVQFRFKRESNEYLWWFAAPWTVIVPKEVVEFYGNEFTHHPIGTGPYRLKVFQPLGQIVWEKNPTFRERLGPNKPDKISVSTESDWNSLLVKIREKKIDWIQVPVERVSELLTATKELTPLLQTEGLQVISGARSETVFEVIRWGAASFQKVPGLRRAVCDAIDASQLVNRFFENRFQVADSLVGPTSMLDFDHKTLGRKTDVAKSQAFIQKLVDENGTLPDLIYLSPSDDASKKWAQAVQAQLKVVGIGVKIKEVDRVDYLSEIDKGEGDLFHLSWRAEYPHPARLFEFLGSGTKPLEGNAGKYANPLYDLLIEKLQRDNQVKNAPPVASVVGQLQEILNSDCPLVPIYHPVEYGLVRTAIRGAGYQSFSHTGLRALELGPQTR